MRRSPSQSRSRIASCAARVTSSTGQGWHHSGAGLAVRAPVTVPLLAARSELIGLDGGTATATRLARSLIDIRASAMSQITGGGLLGTPAVCHEQLVAGVDHAAQVANLADRRTRMYPLKEQQLRAIERAEACEVSLIQQCFTDRAMGLSRDPRHCLVGVPIRSEQVGPEMPYDGGLSR